MIAWIISSTVLILVVLALRLALKNKISARLRYGLWALVLIRLLMPWSLGSTELSVMAPLEQTAFLHQAEAIQPYVSIAHTPSGAIEGYRENGPPTTVVSQASDSDFAQMQRLLQVRNLLEPAWILGIFVILVVFVTSNLIYRRKLSANRNILDQPGCPLPVYACDAVETPCLFGLLHPAIYLPRTVSGNDTIMQHALAHELTHYRQGDHIWAHLRCLCLALHWYNSLVWLAALLSRRDGELACDEGTIARLGEAERISYGKTLLELTCANRASLLHTATTMTGSKRSLRERISRIAVKPHRLWQATLAVVLAACLLVACTFTGPQETTTPGTTEHIPATLSITQRMAALTEDEVFWETQAYPELIPALNAAAEHPVQTPNEGHPSYSMVLYLNKYHSTEESHFQLYACPEENVVKIFYQNPIGEMGYGYFESEELYRIIQNHGRRIVVTEQEPYYHHRFIIDAVATQILNEHGFTDFSVLQFQTVDIFDGYTVYEWDAYFSVADEENVSLTGEMYLDGLGRVRGAIEEPYFVVREDGETRFFHRDLYAQGQDEAETAIRQAFASELPITIPGLAGTPLTAEEVAQVSAAFAPFVYNDAGSPVNVNPLSCFFTSYYSTVEALNFEEFLRYCPDYKHGVTDQEFEALKASGAEECRLDSMEQMPTPIRRYPRSTVDAMLQKYAGITTADLDTSQVDYLPEYDSFYNYTSDLGPGSFHCIAGSLDGDTAYLYSAHSILTMKLVDGSWLIHSLLPIE